jgi:hypothetical protein
MWISRLISSWCGICWHLERGGADDARGAFGAIRPEVADGFRDQVLLDIAVVCVQRRCSLQGGDH